MSLVKHLHYYDLSQQQQLTSFGIHWIFPLTLAYAEMRAQREVSGKKPVGKGRQGLETLEQN